MSKQDELNFPEEKKNLEENYRDSINELRKISWFVKVFIKMADSSKNIYESKNELKDFRIDTKKQTNSILFQKINSMYKSFDSFLKESNKHLLSMESDLLKPFDDFIDNQLKTYNENLAKIQKINNDYSTNKKLVDNSENNYICSAYLYSQSEEKDSNNSIFTGERDINVKIDNAIRKKMVARSDEHILKYEIFKYNKNMSEKNDEYNSLLENIVNLEKTKVDYVSSLLTKFKNYLSDYAKMINNFISELDKFNTKEINEQDIASKTKYLTKFNEDMKMKNETRIPKKLFVPYQTYIEKIKPSKEELSSMKIKNINTKIDYDEDTVIDTIKEFVNNLLDENDIGQDKVANIFELFYYKDYEVEKKILNYIDEKREMSSLVFLNLQNLEYLANILSFISLHDNSILKPDFNLNLKIIFIGERIYYKKKSNNDKIYLSALLSKNKYYRTKQFWRNIIEIKLANKFNDHIERIKFVKNKDKQIKGLFKNFFLGDFAKKSYLAKTRLMNLTQNFSNLDSDQVQILEKIVQTEVHSLIKENIPIFANFNFPSELCLDLIAELTEEYRVSKDNIKFYVTYFNVSSYTIRKLIPNEINSTINIYKQFVSIPEINKKLKLFKNIVPFLTYKDYNNLLLCSKLFHKKLSKIIYKFILRQKNLPDKIRLSIWHNLLGIEKLKKEYNYQEVLSKADDEKVKREIELDVLRTTVGNVENPSQIREQITNVLYAVAQLNGKTRYCQGMNFIVEFLFEKFGEEESFYIFLSFFKNTDYKLIFEKDLEELKILFYTFRRVISLLEPELSSYFNSNGIDVNFFVTPWFITLFTGAHQNFKDENDNSEIMLRILDNFIVSGLKSIMEVGCVLLHSYMNELMSKRYENMMEFLINDMLRTDFFSKKNTEFVENFFNETKISKKLVKNIEEEYRQTENQKAKGENKI